jgi:hypothetical protein
MTHIDRLSQLFPDPCHLSLGLRLSPGSRLVSENDEPRLNPHKDRIICGVGIGEDFPDLGIVTGIQAANLLADQVGRLSSLGGPGAGGYGLGSAGVGIGEAGEQDEASHECAALFGIHFEGRLVASLGLPESPSHGGLGFIQRLFLIAFDFGKVDRAQP